MDKDNISETDDEEDQLFEKVLLRVPILVSVKEKKNAASKIQIWNLKSGKVLKEVDFPNNETILGIKKTLDSKIVAISSSESATLFF